MKKPIILSVLFFIITAISSFGQGEGFWIEENVDPETGLRTGKIEIFFGEEIIEIKPNADLRNALLERFDLRNVNLQGANLSGAELSRADINGANLEGANLENARFSEISSGNLKGTPSALPDGYKIINGYLVGNGVSLYDANLEGADLQGMDLGEVSFRSANLEGANLTGANLYSVIWENVKGTPSTLPEGYFIIKGNLVGPYTNLKGADLDGTNLDGLNLDGAELEGASLRDASLINASLKNAYFKDANLSGADLSRAYLENAKLIDANLSGADLSRANLENAYLRGANLTKANLSNANLRSAYLVGSLIVDINLSGAILSETRFANDGDNLGTILNSFIYSDIQSLKEQIENGGFGGGISPEQAAAITSNTESVNEVKNAIFIGGSSIIPALLTNDQEQRNSITANTTKIEELDGILKTADETLEAYSESIDTLNKNDQILNDNDASIMAEINAMKAQLQTLVAQVAEKDKRIAELEQGGGGQSLEQVLEQVQDARAGSVVLTVDPDGDNITLGLTIEQSDNLIEWTKLDGEMTRTIPIPDDKKFYRFALDK